MTVKSPAIDKLHGQCGDPAFVTRELRSFRERFGITVKEAGYILGVPARTLEGVEQGREFPYPALLVKAMISMQAAVPQQACSAMSALASGEKVTDFAKDAG